MSLAVKPVPSYLCIDPRINLHPNYEYIVEKGPLQNTNQVINAVTVNNSAIVFTNFPPSISTFTSRNVDLKVRVSITASGVNATPGTNLLQLGTHDSLKWRPLNTQLIQTTTATINNTSTSVNNSDVYGALLRTNISENYKRYNDSFTPCSIRDQFQNYEDFENPAYPWFDQYSQNNNPMGPVGQGFEDGRGGFVLVSRTKIDDNNEILVYDITEALMVSPFIDGPEQQGFIGINQLNVNLTLSSQAINGSLWSHSTYGNQLNSISVNIISAALLINFMTPPETMIIPRGPIPYPYYEVTRYPTNIGSIAAGATQSGVQSNNIQLPVIPSRMFIFARRDPSTNSFNTPDTFAYLDNLNITFANKNSVLGSSDPRQLYEISCRNGLKGISWSSWSRDEGSVLIIDPVHDLGLLDDESAGVMKQIQLQIRVDVHNINQSKAIPFQLMVVVVNSGVWTIDSSTMSCVSQIGIVTPSDVVNSNLLPLIDYHSVHNMYGGDFATNLQTAGKKIFSVAQRLAPYVKEAIKTYGPVLADLARNVGQQELFALEGEGEYEGDGRRRKRRVVKRRY